MLENFFWPLVGFKPLPFLGIHLKKERKTISIKNVVINQSTPIKTPSKILAKIKETYLYYTIRKFLPNQIASPAMAPKCWVQELHLSKNPQHLIVNPGDS